MRVLITGGKGFLGSRLAALLTKNGHQINFLTRRPNPGSAQDIYWNPEENQLDPKLIEGFEAVIHLAGDSIAAGRWTSAKKDRIRNSRVHGTRILSQALAKQFHPPKTFITASAIGFYGHRGDEPLSEASLKGTGFLSDVCFEWEAAADTAKDKGIRVAHARIGIVLGPGGGALAKMLLPFKMGMGGKLGSGEQFMSWVSVDDVIRALDFSLTHQNIRGPFNVTAPTPVTNEEFTKTLGKVLHRPTILPAPGFGLRLLLGEMADALLLSSTRVYPSKLEDAGFKFTYSNLETALQSILSE